MKILQAKFETIVWRYFLMMAVVIIFFLAGQHMMGILLALPVFLSALLGVVFWEPKSHLDATQKKIRSLTKDKIEIAA